jgi:hypothetical protein
MRNMSAFKLALSTSLPRPSAHVMATHRKNLIYPVVIPDMSVDVTKHATMHA